jgi:hypothetical protein
MEGRFDALERETLTKSAAGRRLQTQELIQVQRLARMAVTAALLAPPELVEHGPVLCPIRRATGVPCPSCGLTRSWTAVAHGRFGDGFRMHPLGPPAFLAAVALSLTPRRWLERIPPYPMAVMPAFAAMWIGVWLIRLVAGLRSD